MGTAGVKGQPGTGAMAKAMGRTGRPKGKGTPTYPKPRGTPAAGKGVPQPPKTSQKVPKNSAAARFESGIGDLLFPNSSLTSDSRDESTRCVGPKEWRKFSTIL